MIVKNFVHKPKSFVKNSNVYQKSKCLSKIQTLSKKPKVSSNFIQESEIFRKKLFFPNNEIVREQLKS